MKKIETIFLLLLCFIFVGCSSPTEQQKNIYNDEKLITREGDSYYSKKIDTSKLNSIYFEDFTGSYTIWKKQVEESTDVNITLDCNVKKGKYKIVLIKDNETYETIMDNEEAINRNVKYSLDSGKYIIKVIGLYSSFDIKYVID